MIYLLGGRGRLARALGRLFPGAELSSPERSVYEDWWQSDAADRVARYFSKAAPGSSILVTSGLLDPSLSRADHERVNLQLPVQVIEGARKAGLRVLTFGTVMERLQEPPNVYIDTKASLGRHVAQRAAAGDAVTHLQIHTLYGGGEPAPFMFLGQMCRALREGRPFEMSPGRQLREYHHVDDDAVATRAVLGSETDGVIALSHGEPCSLGQLASHVFQELGQPGLLRIGALPEPQNDNYAAVLPRPACLEGVEFRSAMDGVVEYLRSLVSSRLQA